MDFRIAYILMTILALLTKCTARSRLSLWIDEDQIQHILGRPLPIQISIIDKGRVREQVHQADFLAKLPNIRPEVDTVNLTWEAGDEQFTYWFDGLESLNKSLLYNPMLSIPASGIIPKGPKMFQVSIPCTGTNEGVATFVLGLQVTTQSRRPIRGSPIKMKLKKECKAFETTTLCKAPCQHGGRCNEYGECECVQGYQGKNCEIDMCNPSCDNNGTCISANMCLCLDGFYGARCEKALCERPCHNGGHCVQPGSLQPGICWCTSGFYGEACEYSYCRTPCKHDGLCVGKDMCSCRSGYTGDHCEKGGNRQRRRLQKGRRKKNNVKRKNKKRKRCRKKKAMLAKRCRSIKKRRGRKKDKENAIDEPTRKSLRCRERRKIKCPSS